MVAPKTKNTPSTMTVTNNHLEIFLLLHRPFRLIAAAAIKLALDIKTILQQQQRLH